MARSAANEAKEARLLEYERRADHDVLPSSDSSLLAQWALGTSVGTAKTRWPALPTSLVWTSKAHLELSSGAATRLTSPHGR